MISIDKSAKQNHFYNVEKDPEGKKIIANTSKKRELEPYLKVAKGMESEFIKFMLEQMRKTVIKEENDSSELEFYGGMLDEEYSKMAAEKDKGLGIRELLLSQITPSHLRDSKMAPDQGSVIEKYNEVRKNGL